MTKQLLSIDPESILFFDIETVRANKELDMDSREGQLYQKKIRNKETDELPTEQEAQEDYAKRGALRICYTKIVCIGVGFIKGEKLYIKSIKGSEAEIIKEFIDITGNFEYLCGMNILGYDLPIIYTNGFKYHNMAKIMKDPFITAGKKPWELKNILDLMDIFRGTHYANPSLDEICMHFDIPTPKGDLDGSKVSEEYYTNGVDKITEYVKRDVQANVNIYRKMTWMPIFDTFVDRDITKTKIEERPLLQRLMLNGYLSEEISKDIRSRLHKKKLTLKEKTHIKDILIAAYTTPTDDVETLERKINEITILLNPKN